MGCAQVLLQVGLWVVFDRIRIRHISSSSPDSSQFFVVFSLLSTLFFIPFLVLFPSLPLYQPLSFLSIKFYDTLMPTTIDPIGSKNSKLIFEIRQSIVTLKHITLTSHICANVSGPFHSEDRSFRCLVVGFDLGSSAFGLYFTL